MNRPRIKQSNGPLFFVPNNNTAGKVNPVEPNSDQETLKTPNMEPVFSVRDKNYVITFHLFRSHIAHMTGYKFF